MRILSIETSCDETSIAIVDAKGGIKNPVFKVLAHETASQIELHTQYGGVFPMMAKREHSKNIVPLFIKALKKAKMLSYSSSPLGRLGGVLEKALVREPEMLEIFLREIPKIKIPKIDLIAVTAGPGLEPALWVGINFAQALGKVWKIPVRPINHMEGHVMSVLIQKPTKMSKSEFLISKKNTQKVDVKFPAISLLVSGGHTEIVLVKNWMEYKMLGATRDDAAGEAFDKVARMLDLPYPGGPEISRLAQIYRKMLDSTTHKIVLDFCSAQAVALRKGLPKHFSSDIHFPRPMINSKDFDFSFSGLKTAVLYYIRDKYNPTLALSLSREGKMQIAKEFEDAVVEVLVTKTLRAVEKYEAKSLIVGGGVSANNELQNQLKKQIKNKKLSTKLYLPIKNLSTDNALMIALAGYFRSVQGKKYTKKIKASGNLGL